MGQTIQRGDVFSFRKDILGEAPKVDRSSTAQCPTVPSFLKAKPLEFFFPKNTGLLV